MTTVTTIALLAAALWAFTRFALRGENLARYDEPGQVARAEPPDPGAGHQEVLELLREFNTPAPGRTSARQRLVHLREKLDSLGERADLDGVEIRPVDLGGISGEWVLAAGADPARRLLYLHGGAFTMGSCRSHRGITATLSRLAGAAVLAIDYRLMPEHRRLDCLTDCQRAYRWILDNGPQGAAPLGTLFVAGDSAGGNLCLALIAWARDAGLRGADAAVALSPVTDGTLSSPSLLANLHSDHMLGPMFGRLARVPSALLLWISWFINRVRPCDPRVSPAHGSLHGLPPTLIHASEAEMLLDDARRYVNKARAAGSDVRLQTWHHMVHVWHAFGASLPEATEAFGRIAAFLENVKPRGSTTSETRACDITATDIRPFDIPAAWDAATLQRDDSWIIRLTDADRDELDAALACFKDAADARGLTAQWLHGHMMPTPATFPLPVLGRKLAQAQADLEHRYGVVLVKGFPVGRHGHKDTQLLYAGLCSHVGTLRPQTVFGELVQEIRDSGQASLKERRGSKHNRALSFHNDPCDVISLLCLQPAHSGGEGLLLSSVSLHNALLAGDPQHVRTLYEDFTNTYQDYLFVRTGFNRDLMPRQAHYAMPTFSAAQGHFACKYSRFYIDQAQELPEVPRLTPSQRAALDALEREMHNEKWWLRIRYEPGDAVFSNNFVCMHARTAFRDDPADERRKRHLLRIWLAAPNSRPLSPRYRHFFFPDVAAGAVRGGLQLPPVDYS